MYWQFSTDNATKEEGISETTEEKPTDTNSSTKDHKTGEKNIRNQCLSSINGAECITVTKINISKSCAL